MNRKKLKLWDLGLRWMRLNPLAFLGVLGLAIGQLSGILLIARVFNGSLSINIQASQLGVTALMIIVLNLVINAGLYFSRILSARIACAAVSRLRMEMLDLIYTRAQEYYVHTSSGAMHSTLVVDTELLQRFFEAILGQLFPALLVGIGICFTLVDLNPILAILLLVSAPVILIAYKYSLKPLQLRTERRMKAYKAFI